MGDDLSCEQCCDFYWDANRRNTFEVDGLDMKIPKNFQEKRDELARDWTKGWNPSADSENSVIALNYKKGFNDCANLLLPEIEKLEKALFRLTVRLDESASIHDIKPSAEIVRQALQSLREFLGEESEDK